MAQKKDSTSKARGKSSRPRSAGTHARSTASSRARSESTIADAAAAKQAGAEALARWMPFNAAKPSEIGAQGPAAGQTVEPPQPMISGSTLTENNAS